MVPKNEKHNYKLIYDVEIYNIKQKRWISTKILKMDENNQYINPMTKPLPYGCIKKGKNSIFIWV